MRLGARWDDVCILNLSSRGLMARSAVPPSPGTYVEMRRGTHVIVARVVWTDQERFGVMTQDVLPLDAIISDQKASPEPQSGPVAVERRQTPRTSSRDHDRSREVSRLIEYCVFAIGAVSVALFAFVSLQDAFAKPLEVVGSALALENDG